MKQYPFLRPPGQILWGAEPRVNETRGDDTPKFRPGGFGRKHGYFTRANRI